MKRFLFALLLALWASPSFGANLFAVCSTACTWNNVSTAMWSASSGGATGAGPPTSADQVILDGATCVGGTTCTITVNANITVTALTMGACTASTTGCRLDFSTNNNNINITSQFSCTGSGVRRLDMGNGTWTMPSSSNLIWDCSNTTNMTLNANGSTIFFPSSNVIRTFFTSNAVTYNTIQIANSSSGSPVFAFGNAAFKVNNLIVGSGMRLNFLTGGSHTINTSLSVAGTSTNTVFWDGQGSAFVVNGTATMNEVGIRDSNFSGTAFTANNSFNLGNNAGVTINQPGGGAKRGKFSF